MRVAGIGFRRGATLASLRDVLVAVGGDVVALATAEDKADAQVLRVFSAEIGVPILSVALAELREQATPTLTQRLPARYGAGSLAEAAALAAAGPGARLTVTRVVSADGMATAAIAEGDWA
ncbi:cobalamin biosynthesis protein [Paracoccaceae bacterium Fryx2]|nr:cobalamin biosynthesis protein [Paracoccaceae bacterium Fryx2]